jgi:hypothetical protein
MDLQSRTPAAADIIETFDNGSDNGDWHLTSNPLWTLGIQPSGGRPEAYLRGDVESATPTWYVPLGTATNFLADYYAKGVISVAADINIFDGNQEPNRTLTLDLLSYLWHGRFCPGGSKPITSGLIFPRTSQAGCITGFLWTRGHRQFRTDGRLPTRGFPEHSSTGKISCTMSRPLALFSGKGLRPTPMTRSVI